MARPPNFRSTWAKIERAKLHRDLLERQIAEHFRVESNQPRCVGKYDSYCDCHVFRVTFVPDSLPGLLEDASAALGDIAHNFRSALNHLAYQLALVQAKERGHPLTLSERGSVQFPIYTRSVRWRNWQKTNGGLFRAPDFAAMKRFQPYRGRAGRPDNWHGPYRHQLTLLAQLSNRDKHRLPNVIAPPPSKLSMGWLPQTALFTTRHILSVPPQRVVLGAEVFRYAFGPGVQDMDVKARITPTISLPKRGPITAEVDRIGAFVVEIVRAFDPIAEGAWSGATHDASPGEEGGSPSPSPESSPPESPEPPAS